MTLNLISVAMLVIGVIVVYSGIVFLHRPDDALNKSIHYDSSTMELTDSLRFLSTVVGVLLGLLGLAIVLFAALAIQ